ncbi:hypothetical protein MNBD_NITROSPINAE04-2434 [hydrothermal vent metagenome]|uniref:Uncharacterized protein n=1 Tax=hydrothermal vent metagenome TaxID=652676 RepID=A0A3B1BWC3_9ZZZZ
MKNTKAKKLFLLSSCLLAFIIGIILLVFAVPRVIATAIMLPGEPVRNAIQSNKTVSTEDLDILVSTRKDALKWISSGRTWTDLGLAQSWKAYYIGYETVAGKALLSEAVDSMRHGLSYSPANSFAWARLGYDYIKQSGSPSENAMKAYRMSLLTASYEPRLLFDRLIFCFYMWDDFSKEDRYLINQQIGFAAGKRPWKLAKIAYKDKNANAIIRSALDSDSEEYKKFAKIYKRIATKNKK